MSVENVEERWRRWEVQARNFARRDNYTEAVARMCLVERSVKEALSTERDSAARHRLERHLLRAEELCKQYEQQLDEWRSKIAQRRQQTIDQAAEEMARPLPLEADQR